MTGADFFTGSLLSDCRQSSFWFFGEATRRRLRRSLDLTIPEVDSGKAQKV